MVLLDPCLRCMILCPEICWQPRIHAIGMATFSRSFWRRGDYWQLKRLREQKRPRYSVCKYAYVENTALARAQLILCTFEGAHGYQYTGKSSMWLWLDGRGIFEDSSFLSQSIPLTKNLYGGQMSIWYFAQYVKSFFIVAFMPEVLLFSSPRIINKKKTVFIYRLFMDLGHSLLFAVLLANNLICILYFKSDLRNVKCFSSGCSVLHTSSKSNLIHVNCSIPLATSSLDETSLPRS